MEVQPLPAVASAAALGAIATSIRTLLGPQQTLKCAHATSMEATLISGDALAVLDRLGVWHPAGVLLLEAAEALHKEHGSGVTTLIYLTGELASSVVELCRQVRLPSTAGRTYETALSAHIRATSLSHQHLVPTAGFCYPCSRAKSAASC